LASHIKVNPNPARKLQEYGNPAQLVNFINESEQPMTRRNLIYAAKNRLNLTHTAAINLVWKCLEPNSAYLMEVENT